MEIVINDKMVAALTQDASRLLASAVDWTLSTGLRVILITLLILASVKLSRRAINAVFARVSRSQDVEYAKRIDTLHSITAFTLKAGILAVGGFVVLGQRNNFV